MSEFAIPRNFETYLHVPNATTRFDEALSVAATIGDAGVALSPNLDHAPYKSHSSHLFTFEATRQLALVEAVIGEKNRKRICFYVGW